MIGIYVPSSPAVRELASVVGYITEGLDAVVIETQDEGEKGMFLRLAGNDRDLGLAMERAIKIGGFVD